MGVVYRAELDDQLVAIKVLHPHLTSDLAVVGRFVREHQALSRIDHPNVVRVIDLIIDDPRLGIVMEHLDYPDLDQVIADDAIDPQRAVRLGAGIAAGVAAIHDARVVHRDLKPANVIVTSAPAPTYDDVFDRAGQVVDLPKIADFGVSRLVGQSIIAATTTLGTPLYMSPEAAAGNPVGPPADIYSLGVILFEMLTGRPPYAAEEPIAVAVAHINSPVPVLGGVPDQLSDLLQAMLDKSPDRRPEAAAVATQLVSLAPHLTPTLRPVVLNEHLIDQSDSSASPPARRQAATVLIPGGAVAEADAGGFGDQSWANTAAPMAPGPTSVLESPTLEPSPATGFGGGPHDPNGHGPGPANGYRRPMSATTASSVRRQMAPLVAGLLALVLILPMGWFLWNQTRSDSNDSDLAAGNAAFSFMPRVATNGLITTRRWELATDVQSRRIIKAEVIVANTGDEPISATHYEAFPEQVDVDYLVETFRPEPDAIVYDPGVAVFEMSELTPRARFNLTYTMLAPEGVESVEELQALAESQAKVETAFLESLPSREAQEAMDTEGVLTALSLSPSSLELAVGDVASAELVGQLSDGSSVDPAALAAAVWTIGDPTIAEVTESNGIRGLKTGETTLTVSVGEIEITIDINVVVPEIAATTTTEQPTTTSEETTSTSLTTSSTDPTTTSSTTLVEPTLTMSPLTAAVKPDGGFIITFSTNLCTIASYSGAGQSYTTPGWPDVGEVCWQDHSQSFTPVQPGSYEIFVRTRSQGGQQVERQTTVNVQSAEPTLTMSQPVAEVNEDGSFVIRFSTNLCTIASYSGAGQSYTTPGWPDVIGPCWQDHGQSFTAVAPGSYDIAVRARSAGGQQRLRTVTVDILDQGRP